MTPSTVSIGFHREDGDFQLLATLNNNDGLMGQTSFDSLIETVRFNLACMLQPTPIVVIERQDAPDYITTEEQA